MTDKDRIALAGRAQAVWDEFIAPMLNEMRDEYRNRIVEIANTELHPGNRSDKITALSNALKVLANLEGGMLATIRDGEMAKKALIKAENIEQMSDARQRLLRITG